MLLLFFILNFGISWLNAWGCGKTWASTHARGGSAHFMNWMGAIMSASGFTWCYLVLVTIAGAAIPIENEETGLSAPLLSPEMAQAVFDLGYLVIILPVLGSGIAITVASWRQFARSRSLLDGGIAGWNTYAQISNIYSAVEHVPDAFGNVTSFFGGSSKSDKKGGLIIVLLVVLAVIGGILTTFAIIRSTARNAVLYESYQRDLKAA